MTRATSFYILMLVIFGSGLWAIVTVGSIFLQAPPDISGRWELRPWHSASDAPVAHHMHVEQSGIYVKVTIDGQSRSLRLEQPADNDRRKLKRLVGPETELILEPTKRDSYVLQSKGLIDGTWQANSLKRQPGALHARQH
jgi:hypothetical protein